VPKGGPVWPDFARGPCLLHRKPFGVTSQVDVYVVRSYSILSDPQPPGHNIVAGHCDRCVLWAVGHSGHPGHFSFRQLNLYLYLGYRISISIIRYIIYIYKYNIIYIHGIYIYIYISGFDQVWPPQLFYTYTYFYNHAHAHRLRLEKLLHLELSSSRSSNGFFKPLLDPDGGFTSETAERRFQN
jgi:hypothetical protein